MNSEECEILPLMNAQEHALYRARFGVDAVPLRVRSAECEWRVTDRPPRESKDSWPTGEPGPRSGKKRPRVNVYIEGMGWFPTIMAAARALNLTEGKLRHKFHRGRCVIEGRIVRRIKA